LKDAGVKGPLYQRVQMRVINPKAVTMGQLYGEWVSVSVAWGAAAVDGGAEDPLMDRGTKFINLTSAEFGLQLHVSAA